jgi:uncharacterized membrane protein YoaK (UPF0700 family)
MLQKLGSWAWIGGGALAGIAGMINAIGYLSYTHQAVTHLTGTTSLFAIAVGAADFTAALHLGFVVISFFLGSVLSGFIIQRQTLRLGRRYGAALALEGLLLLLAAFCMRRQLEAGSYLASAACGLQNAMATTYSGAVLRTTHVTGIVTDIGSALGHALRGLEADWPRLRLYGLVLTGFVVGGIVGALLFNQVGTDALFYPAALTLIVALAYTGYAHQRRLHPPAP